MTDREVVDAFVVSLRRLGHVDLRICCRPDEINRTTNDIDAIAGNFAIEHTSIDTIPDQRRDSARFMQVIGVLEAEFRDNLPFRLGLTVDYDAVAVGQAWDEIQAGLRNWISRAATCLPDGRHVVHDIAGVPFPLHVRKSSSGRPGVVVSRFAPADDTMSARARALLDRKAQKLVRYKCLGYTTILLLESSDIALMNEATLLEALRAAYPSGIIPGVDQVWYADTSIPPSPEFIDVTAFGGPA